MMYEPSLALTIVRPLILRRRSIRCSLISISVNLEPLNTTSYVAASVVFFGLVTLAMPRIIPSALTTRPGAREGSSFHYNDAPG
jgi:hypothetical protein